MKSKTREIKNIFILKMLYSSVLQLVVLAVITLLMRSYLNHNLLNSISSDLLIKDQYTSDQIASYQMLGETYPLNLELHDLGDMRKLDSIEFVANIDHLNELYACDNVDGGLRLCKISDNEYLGITAISNDQKNIGYILAKKKYDLALSSPVENYLFFILLTVAATFVFNFLFLFLSLKKKIERNTRLLLDCFSSKENFCLSSEMIDIQEYKFLADKFVVEKNEIAKLQEEKYYFDAIKSISAQVAHDIRSPLAALNVIIKDAHGVPEKQRLMIRNATQRINDIANNLLMQYQHEKLTRNRGAESSHMKFEMISSLLDSIVSEKRAQYNNDYDSNGSVKIELTIDHDAYGLFSLVDQIWFKRVISNLINNAVESFMTLGIVEVSCFKKGQYICIDIKDSGCGIPEENLTAIFDGSYVSNKPKGHGIGLLSSKKKIEELGGNLIVDSKVDQGTVLHIQLLQAEIPNWFANKLYFFENSDLVLLDDDQPIHDVWQSRFSSELPAANLNLLHYYSPEILINHEENNVNNSQYLIDYELIGSSINGLDVIEMLNLGGKATLVTSRYDDELIQARCKVLRAKILPKYYAPFVTLHVLYAQPDLILIDDNTDLTSSLQYKAEFTGKKLVIFNSVCEADGYIATYPRDSLIYVDSHLNHGMKGELYAKVLFEMGFTNIYLYTGYELDTFDSAAMYWLKGILKKETAIF